MSDETARPGREIRRLVRACDTAALATLDSATGEPFASLVLVAVDHDAAPLLLLSDLAAHSRNVAADDRVSLLFDGTAGLKSRLTGPRASVQGRLERSAAPRHRGRFLTRHPEAAVYADFGDFAFYRLRMTRAHLVAGFGRIDWVGAGDVLLPAGLEQPLCTEEAGIIEHMNQDHADAVQLYAQALARRGGAGWLMTGCDCEGIDLRRGGEVCRLEFPDPVTDSTGARRQLVAMAARARQLGQTSAAG